MNDQLQFKDNGLLKDYSIADLLTIIGKKSLTGMLRLEQNQIIKVIYLKEGMISFASSNDSNDRLGEVLIKLGKITRAQLDDAIQRLKPNISLGKMLVQLGYLTGKDLLIGAQKQAESIIISLFDWEEGNYSFIEGPLPKQLVDLKMDLKKIIYQGIVSNSTRNWVLKHITSMESIFKLKESENVINEKLQLPEDEKFIVSMLNGKRTLSQISSSSKLDDFQICKVVTALKLLDFAEKVEIPAPAKEIEEKPQKEEIPIQKQEEISIENKESSLKIESHKLEKEIKLESKPIFPFLESDNYQSQPITQEYQEKDVVQEIKEKIIDMGINKTPELEHETPIDKEAQTKIANGELDQQNLVSLAPETQNSHVSTDELVFQLTPDETSKSKYIKLSIMGLLLISAILIALVYYIRYKESSPLSKVHTPIISEAPKTQENVKTLPVDNVAIVSTANPKESVLPQQPTENISLNTISKSQEKEQQTNITISKEPQKPTISEKESIKIPQQEKTNIYENNEWLRAKTYFENNNLTDAAKIWKNYIKKSPLSFTIQVELACQNETISEAYNSIANKNKFYIIPKTYKGKQCYIIGYGIFNERNEAQSNLKELPDLLLQQKFPPRVVYASEMIK